MEKRSKVFLSFAKEDDAMAQAICRRLRELPVNVWSDDDVSAGEDWNSLLPSILREVDFFVLLATPEALESEWVLHELGAAWALKKRIITVVTDRDVLRRIPVEIRPSDVVSLEELSRLDALLVSGPLGSETPVRELSLNARQEIIKVRPRRRFLSSDEWNRFISSAKEDLWFYGIAELGYAKDPSVPAIVQRAAEQGCTIRVLLLDPQSQTTREIEASEQNLPDSLRLRILSALRSYGEMQSLCKGRMEIRLYSMTPTVSIVRSDDRALVTHYLAPLTGDDSPTFEIGRVDNGIFDRYVQHFEAAWHAAVQWDKGPENLQSGKPSREGKTPTRRRSSPG